MCDQGGDLFGTRVPKITGTGIRTCRFYICLYVSEKNFSALLRSRLYGLWGIEPKFFMAQLHGCFRRDDLGLTLQI